MNWLAQCMKNELNWGFSIHSSWHRVYLSVCLFLISFQHHESNPDDFQICWRSCCIYSDIEIKFCQLFRHPQNWWNSSASQHEIPVLLTNLIVYLQTFETSIPRLTLVLIFAIIFDTIPKTKHHKTHLRYHSAYDSRYDKTEFFTFEHATCLELFPVKLTVRTLQAAGNFNGRQTDRRTPTVARNSVSKFSACLEI